MVKPKLIRKGKQKNKSIQDSGWIYIIAPLVVLLGGIGIVGYITFTSDIIRGKENKEANLWAVQHWQTPIPPQGEPVKPHHLLARGIQATDCKNCHPDKYAEWAASLHSQTMGPGVYGQFLHFNAAGQAQCNICHAPSTEQWQETQTANGLWQENSHFNEPLLKEGITCTACHLRQHQRHGPLLQEGKESLSQALHGEAVRTPFFSASEFCKSCHQHKATTLKIGGNTIENTYIEWLNSPAYKNGQTCQSCHMPGRRHLWKGIHDKEMTASGVTITQSMHPQKPKVNVSFKASLSINNTGVGHMFPTYTTPAVFLKAAFLDDAGKVVPGYYEEKIIQRRLNMATDPWTEYFDTRLAPNESMTLEFERKVPLDAKQFMLWIWVEPDQFYEGFFRTTLRNSPHHAGRALLEEALQTTLDRQYSLFSKKIPVES